MNQNAVHLQGIGKVSGKPAGELQPGDVTLWNYGYTATVQMVERRGKSVYVTVLENNQIYERRFLATRIIGISKYSRK